MHERATDGTLGFPSREQDHGRRLFDHVYTALIVLSKHEHLKADRQLGPSLGLRPGAPLSDGREGLAHWMDSSDGTGEAMPWVRTSARPSSLRHGPARVRCSPTQTWRIASPVGYESLGTMRLERTAM